MKIIKLQLLTLLTLLSVNSCDKDQDKDEQRVLGVYYLEGTCINSRRSSDTTVYPDEREVVIKESNKHGLLINIGASANWNDFKASISNDSLFIPYQIWKNFDETQASFRGEGIIKNDSLFLHYEAGGTFGFMECDCKGKQIQ